MSSFLTGLLLFGIVIKSENVKFYLADCVGNLGLDNYHSYTGDVITPPPTNVSLGSTAMFEFEYASRAEFGSYLDGNLNYFAPGASATNLLHYFWNVNSTGGIYYDIEYSAVIGSSICSDVEQNKGKLPQVIGAYIWWIANSTFDKCKSVTNEIPQCTYSII